MNDKAAMRRAALARREACDPVQAARFSTQICAQLTDMTLPKQTLCGGYMPIRGEVDIVPALHMLADRGHAIALPVIVPATRTLPFHFWMPGEPLVEGPYGILQPSGASHAPVMPDILFLPLLAFDARGVRLGYGGGYYDRTLALWHAQEHRPQCIGIAYGFQEMASLPATSHDIRLDGVITEQGMRMGAER